MGDGGDSGYVHTPEEAHEVKKAIRRLSLLTKYLKWVWIFGSLRSWKCQAKMPSIFPCLKRILSSELTYLEPSLVARLTQCSPC